MHQMFDVGPRREEVRQNLGRIAWPWGGRGLRLRGLSGDGVQPHGSLLLYPRASEAITLLRRLQAAHEVSYLQGMVIRAHIHQTVPWSHAQVLLYH